MLYINYILFSQFIHIILESNIISQNYAILYF